MRLEKQKKMENEGSKASSSAVNDDTSPRALQLSIGLFQVTRIHLLLFQV
ncbi:hypothetical protein SAY86_005172 [Trapa natans]|uniref:Uncharacterized protein n=1 Tax=Trapa natans TaxID=22666 RepID=A0AAN7L2D1_TRANT|nr:hypothetical protein SAY86_005172 [Trapa natans]